MTHLRKRIVPAGEEYKGSTFTQFMLSGCVRKPSPYEYIFVQAPHHVACEVVRNATGLDPETLICTQHESCNFSATEGVNLEDVHFFFAQEGVGSHSFLIIRWDAVPYYLAQVWTERHWILDDELLSKDRGKTNEINILTQENRRLRAELEAQKEK